jgi:hypothetical protein
VYNDDQNKYTRNEDVCCSWAAKILRTSIPKLVIDWYHYETTFPDSSVPWIIKQCPKKQNRSHLQFSARSKRRNKADT